MDGGLLSYGEARQCSKSRLPPLFKADTATLTFAKHADGKIRVALGGGRVDRPGKGVEVSCGPQRGGTRRFCEAAVTRNDPPTK